MSYYQWSEAMSVGVKALDADHKILISLINQLHETPPGGVEIGAVFAGLARYAAYHFAREEQVLRAVAYPGLDSHEAEHRLFESDIEVIRLRCLGGRDPEEEAALLDYLKNWLKHHILMIDMHYKPHVAGDPRAEAAARAFAPIAARTDALGA